MSYEPINCTPKDVNTLRDFLKQEKGYLGVGAEGLYIAQKPGSDRVSRHGVSLLADAMFLSVKIQTGSISPQGLAMLADYIIDQYGGGGHGR